MLGLLHTAKDEFTNEVDKPKDISVTRAIKGDHRALDAGLMAGVGYQLMKGTGMYFGVRGFYGLVYIAKDDSGPGVYKRALYLAAVIPMGKGKAAATAAVGA